jgi:hypothetical protein
MIEALATGIRDKPRDASDSEGVCGQPLGRDVKVDGEIRLREPRGQRCPAAGRALGVTS